MAKYDWKIEPRDEDWSDDTYAYFLIHINVKKMAEYLNKELKNEWWCKADYGQDYVWIVAEHKDYPVRLFFNFYNFGTADIVRHYTDGSSYKDELLGSWKFRKYDVQYSFDTIKDNLEKYFDKFEESKKSENKSLKEGYRTMGFIQEVRDTIVKILENPHSDLFYLGYCDGIITYDNDGRARITSNGDVDMDFITLPTYFYSSGYTPKNKKLEKIIDNIMDSNFEYARERLWDENEDELVALGITDKDDEKLNYHDLYDMDAGDLAEELSEYEMDIEGTDLYTDVYCELEEVDEGVELTVSMTIQDEYGHALVKDYKSNTVLLQEDVSIENGDLEEFIEDAIKEVTEQF